ncbi:TspO MBR family protein [Lentilactobacillus rapi DSM 19907 = JCM 15042]|uniref:Tryptophan-rich sensory protein n=2 Tax=Lentilactobacillus rapi TaxID=481723 RepID=A0A512PNN2_9LACO|nr:TspO/MBR family protein [Lentilactobacillus rapi]KRL17123.1 TspO MBR family protein [Lentilactobacillus rapi DSM 19907 = JCM 15042]GEP72815.1 tryptophan-rich sensory protein [Lentilactobacillus rapi]
MTNNAKINWLSLATWIILVEAMGLLSAQLSGDIKGLYNALSLPPLSPSGAVFGIVWPVLYLFIGIVGYLLWSDRRKNLVNLSFFLGQLLLNFVWTIVFFNGSLFVIGLIIIVAMDIMVASLMYRLLSSMKIATWLLSPYLAWLLFATYLAGGVALLNH